MNTKPNQLSLMSLFAAGTHRGNKKSKLNPRLKKFVYGVSNGLCLINLVETKNALEKCHELLFKLGQKRRQVLVVGTSKHLADLTKTYAGKFAAGEMPYVNYRWLGGTLTNWSTIKKTLKTLEKYQNMMDNKEFFGKLSRNEQLIIERDVEKLNKSFAGLMSLKNNRPGAMIVLEANENDVAIKEGDVMKVPVITLTNTGATTLSKDIAYTVVGNTHSIHATEMMLDSLVDSYNQGLAAAIPVAETQPKEQPKK
jgi:small subunit ribosomal protein S2